MCRLQQKMQHTVEKLAAWFSSWALSINNKKSALMVFTSRKSVPSVAVSINGEPIRHVLNHKHLRLVFDSHLSWSAHATALVNKVSQRVGLLRRLRCRLPPLVIRSLYLTAIRPALEYATVAWSGIRSGDAQRLERVQRSAARLITGISPSDRLSSEILLARAGLDPLHLRRQAACAAFAFSLSPGNHDHFPPHMAATLRVWQDLLPGLLLLLCFVPFSLEYGGFLAPELNCFGVHHSIFLFLCSMLYPQLNLLLCCLFALTFSHQYDSASVQCLVAL